MRSRYAWILAGLLACTKAGPNQESATPPGEATFAQPPPGAKLPPKAPPPAPPPAAPKVTVEMTAATLADDCGGVSPRARASRSEPDARSQREDSSRSGARAKRACDQTSMQLSIVMPAGGAATQLGVKKVELFDDKGVLIGELMPRMPTAWAEDGTYKPWDQKVAPGQELSVSYALSQPPWGDVTQRWNRTYVLKAVITVGGGDRSVQRDVHVAAPTMLPPNVRT